jgi:hypothetical protein
VTLTLLWQEYRANHPDGYGYTWFCDRFAVFERRAHATFRNRHEAGAVMQTDYAGHTIPIIDPSTGVIHSAQIFVATASTVSALPSEAPTPSPSVIVTGLVVPPTDRLGQRDIVAAQGVALLKICLATRTGDHAALHWLLRLLHATKPKPADQLLAVV